VAIDFTEKLGPLPVWGWGVIGGGVVAIGAWFMNRGGGEPSAGTPQTVGNDGYQTSGLSMGGTASERVPDAVDNNVLWLTRATRQTSASLSKSSADVYSALKKWLQGSPLSTDEKRIVDAATAQNGTPPEGTQGISDVVTAPSVTYRIRMPNSGGLHGVAYTVGDHFVSESTGSLMPDTDVQWVTEDQLINLLGGKITRDDLVSILGGKRRDW